MRLIILAALVLISHPAFAADPITGAITEDQLKVISMTSMARIAGDGHNCPRFHAIQRAVFEEWREAKISVEMPNTQEFKNAETLAMLGALDALKKDHDEFCIASWQLFGLHGLYHRQLVEEN
jgi:hypothetical protein